MSEMGLVGEAIPSMLASAGTKKDTHFTLSLYCTSKVRRIERRRDASISIRKRNTLGQLHFADPPLHFEMYW